MTSAQRTVRLAEKLNSGYFFINAPSTICNYEAVLGIINLGLFRRDATAALWVKKA